MARKSRANNAPIISDTKNKMWNAGLYGRLSVEDGDDTEQNSIGNQKKIGNRFLAEKPDIVLVDTYSDHGCTGMNFERPDFKRMFKDIKSGRINCIIVKDISRLGRHFVMTSNFVERIFPEMGVRLICVNDGYDSSEPNADSSALTLPLKMVMNDYYVKDISQKIRSSIHAKMDSGEYLPSAGSIPYGYIRDPENNTFQVDEETAPVVLRIFQMRADRVSFNGICRELNSERIPCPGKIRYERGVTMAEKYKDALWIPGTVRKITQDTAYIGCRVHGKAMRSKVGLDKKRRPEDEWKIIENAHPALVPEKLFDYVQRVNFEELEKRKHYVQRNGAEEDYRDLFRGLVYCADCRSLMSAGKGCARVGANTPSRIFYDCNTYRYSGHTRCTSHYVRQEQIYAVVKNAIDQQTKVAVDIEQLVASIKNSPETKRVFTEAAETAEGISAKRQKVENRMERLLTDLTEQMIDRNEYGYMKARYSQQLKELLDAEEAAAARRNAVQKKITVTQEWICNMKEYQSLPALTPEILRLLIKEIQVHSNRSITIVFNFGDPYKSITELRNCVEEVRQVG